MAVHLDGATIIRRLTSNDSEPIGYMYNNPNVLWFIQTTSFAALNITCSYISSTLANLLCAFVVIKQSHVVLRSTIKGISIVLNILLILITVIVGVYNYRS